MPVYKDEKRGTWYCSFQYKDPQTGKFKTKKKRGFATKREASAYEVEQRHDNRFSKSSITFKEAFDEFYSTKQLNKRKMQQAVQKASYFKMQAVPLTELKSSDLVQWRNEVGSLSLATSTKNNIIMEVRKVMKYAAATYDIPVQASLLKGFRKTQAEKQTEMETWTPEQYNQFRATVTNRLYQIMFDFLFWTGVRRGELRAVQKKDVDFNAEEVYIHYSIEKVEDGLQPVKTPSSMRHISLDKALLEELREVYDSMEGSYLFGGEQAISNTTLENALIIGTAKAGLPHITLHGFRHSHATWLLAKGVPVSLVSKRLGHSNPSITYHTYAHVFRESEEQMLELLNETHKSH